MTPAAESWRALLRSGDVNHANDQHLRQRAPSISATPDTGAKGSGMILLVPFVQQMVRVNLRTLLLDVPSQDVISRG